VLVAQESIGKVKAKSIGKVKANFDETTVQKSHKVK
jgi:hypothetical protein